MSRTLEWDGCVNVRDLGGLPTVDGSRTRYGAVVRSDNVRRLTEAGWDALAAHGVTTVVDLRWPHELAEDPLHDVPIDVVHVSVLGEHAEAYERELDARLSGVVGHAERACAVYLDMLETFPTRFGEAVAAVADAREGAVLVHCAAGKDRTGIVVAFALAAAGVGDDVIAADYAESGAALPALHRRWLDDAPDEEERARRAALEMQQTPSEAMTGLLAGLRARHGGVVEFLREAGVDDEQLRRIRARLREDA